MSIKPILFEDDVLKMLDQRLLPTREVWLEYRDYREVAEAIRTMVVRGAPAIGVAAAFGAALGAREIYAASFDDFMREFEEVCAVLAATRPTAVNLFWALERMKSCARQHAQLAGMRPQAAPAGRGAGDRRRGRAPQPGAGRPRRRS